MDQGMGTLDPAADEVGDPARVAWGAERGHDQRAALSCARRHAQNAFPKRACPTRACPKREQDRLGRAPDRRLHGCKSRGALLAGSLALLPMPHAHRCRVARACRTGVLHRPAAHLWVPPFQVPAAYSNGLSTCAPCARTWSRPCRGCTTCRWCTRGRTRAKPMITLHARIADVNDGDRIACHQSRAVQADACTTPPSRSSATLSRIAIAPADLI